MTVSELKSRLDRFPSEMLVVLLRDEDDPPMLDGPSLVEAVDVAYTSGGFKVVRPSVADREERVVLISAYTDWRDK